jgi:prostaglandin-H2 D-isomerase / glutathione transferase
LIELDKSVSDLQTHLVDEDWREMMSTKLSYFNFPFWRAEPSRIALHIAEVDWTDDRPNREAFIAMKQSGTLPFGQLPVLELQGVSYGQSNAIARYCGRMANLYPADALKALQVDELMSAPEDLMIYLGATMREKDPERKLELRRTFAQQTLTPWFGHVEERLSLNQESDFAVGDSMTMADLTLWRVIRWLNGGILDGVPKGIADGYQRLQALVRAVENHEGVQSWQNR